MSKIFFDKIPVKKISPEQNECFRTAVTSIQLDYTKEAAASIDTMLFDLYNLTNEERKVIGYIEIKWNFLQYISALHEISHKD